MMVCHEKYKKMSEIKGGQIEVWVENNMQQRWRNATARIFMMLGDTQIVPPKYYGTMIKQNLKMIEDSISHGSSFDDAVNSAIANIFHANIAYS